MASSGDVEAVPEPGVHQPADACMEGGGDGGLVETTEESRPVEAETTSVHHAAAAPEQAAERSTSEDGEEEKQVLLAAAKEEAAGDGQESARERLKRHRREMAGRVWVPEMWGQEKLLKDWADCTVFDLPLVPAGLLTARQALVAECCARRPDRTPPAGSSPLRVQNGYSSSTN